MFAVNFAGFFFITVSSFSKMPISGTHTVVGALLGAGIIAGGLYLPFAWDSLGGIIFYWFASPAFGALLSFLLMITLAKFTLNTQKYSF